MTELIAGSVHKKTFFPDDVYCCYTKRVVVDGCVGYVQQVAARPLALGKEKRFKGPSYDGRNRASSSMSRPARLLYEYMLLENEASEAELLLMVNQFVQMVAKKEGWKISSGKTYYLMSQLALQGFVGRLYSEQKSADLLEVKRRSYRTNYKAKILIIQMQLSQWYSQIIY